MVNRSQYPNHPDGHDYRELEEVYDHEDDRTTLDRAATGSPAFRLPLPSSRGPRQQQTVVKDLGDGWKQVTFIDWVEPVR